MQPLPNRMETHVKVVAAINIVFAALFFLVALALLVAFGVAAGITGATSGVGWLPGFLAGLGFLLVVPFAAVAVLYLLAGIRLNQRRRSGKTLGFVTAVLSLFSIPFGTAFGIYAIWAFVQPETDALLVP